MNSAEEEGVIKFDLDWEPGPAPSWAALAGLPAVRDRLHRLRLIGEGADGIGYGNVSQRTAAGEFVISGTQTGRCARTSPEDYARVTDWDIVANRLRCTGPLRASSESLTHAAVYELGSEYQVVLHVHSAALWTAYRGVMPTTPAAVEYGTPAMAEAVRALHQRGAFRRWPVFIMAGHQDGVTAFGSSAEACFLVLANLMNGLHA